ncbi:hypothetical protein EVAR_69198_1 [Eumeta japonica]|uniref:Uncharacterized protein n=1 Tax=Eumeta variegata TaxID=151549 RepID=A0A4C1T0Z0_EUMVA|nr:hypothetical protein EVAR_69198_1 [Eumeta japonica]
MLSENRNETLVLCCVPVAANKHLDVAHLSGIPPSCKSNSLGTQVNLDLGQSSLEEEYVDEELHPRFVDKILTEPFDIYKLNTDSLPQYDDEEPVLENFSRKVDVARIEEMLPSDTHQPGSNFLMEYVDRETNYMNVLEPLEEVNKEIPNLESFSKLVDLKSLQEPLEIVQTAELEAKQDADSTHELKECVSSEGKILQSIENAELNTLFYNNTDQNMYNVLPEFDKSNDSDQIITYEHHDEADQELAKENLAENNKGNKPNENNRSNDSEMAVLTIEQAKAKGCSAETSICKSKMSAQCVRDSFPVTITEVTNLGANSLYVKWKIHDCSGIGGYEPLETSNETLDIIYNMNRKDNKLKSLPLRSAPKATGIKCSFMDA